MISDEAKSVNFREICMGEIAPGRLFRSSHPIKANKQDELLAMLAVNARIASVINLADTVSSLDIKAFSSPWYNSLFKSKRVIALGMDFRISGDVFNQKLKNGLQFIINTEGPYLIHCYAGIDRAGFFSMVLESLMGASINEIIGDYLESFDSDFESSVHNGISKIDSHIVMQLLSVMDNAEAKLKNNIEHKTNFCAISDENLQSIAENYLERTIGLSAGEIALLKEKLSATELAAVSL